MCRAARISRTYPHHGPRAAPRMEQAALLVQSHRRLHVERDRLSETIVDPPIVAASWQLRCGQPWRTSQAACSGLSLMALRIHVNTNHHLGCPEGSPGRVRGACGVAAPVHAGLPPRRIGTERIAAIPRRVRAFELYPGCPEILVTDCAPGHSIGHRLHRFAALEVGRLGDTPLAARFLVVSHS